MLEDLYKNNKPLFFAVITAIIVIGSLVTFYRQVLKNPTPLMIEGAVNSGLEGAGEWDKERERAGEWDKERERAGEWDKEREGAGERTKIEAGQEARQGRYILIHITGAVQKPGVYRVPVPFRVIEAVQLAGGFLDSAKTDSINLAEIVKDGQKVDIPFNVVYSPSSQTADGPVNLNTADITKLKTIPGVGESTAKKIIEYRATKGPFQKIEDLMKIGGIGKGKFERMKGKITI